jgi:hypothetical protein
MFWLQLVVYNLLLANTLQKFAVQFPGGIHWWSVIRSGRRVSTNWKVARPRIWRTGFQGLVKIPNSSEGEI